MLKTQFKIYVYVCFPYDQNMSNVDNTPLISSSGVASTDLRLK